MNILLTHEQMILQERVRDFLERELLPTINKEENSSKFDTKLIGKMGKEGFFSCTLPQEYGGNGWGFIGLLIIASEIGKISASYRPIMTFQGAGCASAVVKFGSEEQVKNIVPRWLSGESIGFVAVTETNAGSDVAGIESTATDCGDYYELNGVKNWVTFAQVGEWGLVFAYTDKTLRYQGLTCFLINLKEDNNIIISPIKNKMGLDHLPTATVSFEGTKIPKDRVVGKPGQGFNICMWILNNGRLSTTAGSLGIMEASTDIVKDYVNRRKQFGRKISSFQMVQSSIAEMETNYEAARLLTYQAAWLKDKELPSQKQTSMAKYFATDKAVEIVNEAITLLGGEGYLTTCPLERYLRDAKSLQIVEGTTNIQKTLIASISLNEIQNRV